MSVTFFIPIMLAHAWAGVHAYARMHTCNWQLACARGGWRQEGPRGRREGGGKERNDRRRARVPCEYNAEGTYRRFQRGIDGDLVAGNSPRLTPLSFSRLPSTGSRRGALLSLLFLLLAAVGPASSPPPSDIAHRRVLPFSTLPPGSSGWCDRFLHPAQQPTYHPPVPLGSLPLAPVGPPS